MANDREAIELPLTYVQVTDADGRRRLQRLERLSEAERGGLLAQSVDRVHDLHEQDATSEDPATGRVRRGGQDHQGHPGLLKDLRQRHPAPQPPQGGGSPRGNTRTQRTGPGMGT